MACFSGEPQPTLPSAYATSSASPSSRKPKQWKVTEQENGLKATGLDFSILCPFTEPPDIEELHALLPSEPSQLDPISDYYFDQLVAALQLDTERYKHVSTNVLQELKKLVKGYTHIFYLPCSPINTITIFEHCIKTTDALLVCKLPYRKSPVELYAL